MATHRSALGKTIDMGQIAAKNENVRAVGNMKVNARGDTIDSNGKVIVSVNKKVGEAYQRTVSNRAANLVRQKNGPDSAQPKENISKELAVEATMSSAPLVNDTVETEKLHPEEMEFENDDEAAEIEALKATTMEQFVIKPASEAPEFVMPDVTKSPNKKK